MRYNELDVMLSSRWKKLLSLIVICAWVCCTNGLYGQTSDDSESFSGKKNTVFIEALGHGFLYSINYERRLFGNDRMHTSAQIGISYYPKQSGVTPLWVPITLIQSIRIAGTSFLEVGAGKMFRNDGVDMGNGEFIDDYQIEEWVFRLGYKYYTKNDRWMFKIAYTPIYQDKSEFIHWGGLGFGYRF